MQDLFKRNKDHYAVISLESGDTVAGKVIEIDSEYVGIQRTRPGPEPEREGVAENFYIRYPSIQYVAFRGTRRNVNAPAIDH